MKKYFFFFKETKEKKDESNYSKIQKIDMKLKKLDEIEIKLTMKKLEELNELNLFLSKRIENKSYVDKYIAELYLNIIHQKTKINMEELMDMKKIK